MTWLEWKTWLTRRRVLALLGGLAPAGVAGWWVANRRDANEGLRAAQRPESFDGEELVLLERILRIVLPSDLTDGEIRRWALRFDRWVTDYDPNAQRDHSMIRPTRGDADFSVDPSPLGSYRDQLAELALVAVGSPSALEEAVRESVRSASTRSVGQTTVRWDRQEKPGIPTIPRGDNLTLDLLSFFYRSREAHDRLYGRQIQRYLCRGLAGVGERPPEFS